MRVAGLTLVVIGICAVLPGSPVVQAQPVPTIGTGGSSGSATGNSNLPGKADFVMRLLRDKGKGEWVRFSDFEQKYYFNNARCQCNTNVRLELFFSPLGVAKKTAFGQLKGSFEILIGEAACLDTNTTTRTGARAEGRCQTLPKGKFNISSFAKSGTRATFDFPASMLFGPKGKQCSSQGTQSIRVLIDTNGDDIPDVTGDAAPTLTLVYDGEPPAAPNDTSISVTGGNEALELQWAQAEGIADFRGFTVFCSRAENLQVFNPSYYTDQYFSSSTVCGQESPTTTSSLTQAQANAALVAFATTSPGGDGGRDGSGGTGGIGGAEGTVDASADPSSAARGPFLAPSGFSTLNKDFVCSDLLRTQRSARITGLQNGIPYLVGVASVDLHGNASPISRVFLQTPVATRDFYNGYREAGGQAQGGFCAFGGRAGQGVTPLVAFACLAMIVRGLARRYRQR